MLQIKAVRIQKNLAFDKSLGYPGCGFFKSKFPNANIFPNNSQNYSQYFRMSFIFIFFS